MAGQLAEEELGEYEHEPDSLPTVSAIKDDTRTEEEKFEDFKALMATTVNPFMQHRDRFISMLCDFWSVFN